MQALDRKDAEADADSRCLLSSILPQRLRTWRYAATRSNAYEKGVGLLLWLVSLEP
jgi:hypothetical protein